MDRKKLYRQNGADIFVAAIILALSITPLFSFNKAAVTGASAYIYEGGKLVKQADMSVDGSYAAGNVEIQIESKRVRVFKSDCPHQICRHTGWISSPAQTIVCVPNKVLVEIRNNGEAQELNAVSY